MTRSRKTRFLRLAVALALATILAVPASAQAKHPLLIYAIDVEGGQSTLIVTPTGASLLVDTGWPTPDSRDTKRIQAAVKDRKGSVQSPKRVEIVDALPLTGLGKPDKKAVRARFWEGAARSVG